MSEDRKTASTARAGKAPIAWHPLFPAIVAVWFGALFGLGILAVRTSLLERAVLASGIDALIPAAAPPLGATARILIALGFALVGGIVGAVIGKTMARSKPSEVARRAEAAAVKAEAASLAAEVAEAPPAAPAFIDIAQLDFDAASTIAPEIEASEHEIALDDDFVFEPAGEPLALDAAIEVEEIAVEPAPRSEPAYFPLPAPLPPAFPAPGGAAAQRLVSADLEDLSQLELIERLAISLHKRREELAAEAERAAEEALLAPAQPAVPAYYPPAPKLAAPALAAAPDGDGDEEGRPIALFPDRPAAGPGHDAAATDRALRDALAALQRMSGAA